MGFSLANYEKDLKYFSDGVSNIIGYLHSNEVYWNMGNTDRLTIGGLLLTEIRINARNLEKEQLNRIYELSNKLEESKDSWLSSWKKKVINESKSRQMLWINYLDDYFSDPEEFGIYYSKQVRLRVLLQLLDNENPLSINMKRELESLDFRLNSKFIDGDFIWENFLKSSFNFQPYWFLYGHIPS